MKTSARAATIFIFSFFVLFNGVQVYLIIQRITGAKAKYNTSCTNALLAALFQADKIKTPDVSARPKNALITYTLGDMIVNRADSQAIEIKSPDARLLAIRVQPASIDALLKKPSIQTLNLQQLSAIYERQLDSFNIHSRFRIDTFPVPRIPGKEMTAAIQDVWTSRRTTQFSYSTNPQRIYFYPNALIFAELNYDKGFFVHELMWPMIGFLFILLISNTALVFVYRTIRKQKRINEVKTDFINNITHEMKTPITIASAGLSALEHHSAKTERTDFYIATSKRQLRILNDFVERILDAALQDEPDITLKKEPIDLYVLFGELIASHSILQGKPVRFSLTGITSAIIPGDRLHLETAFHNLIDNAVKYSNNSIEIDIDLAAANGGYTIKMRDNGIGIPQQYLGNVFEKFFRVPQGNAQVVKGFGLGLYYVHNIIKKHGGTIIVQSKQQAGTTFIITLPER